MVDSVNPSCYAKSVTWGSTVFSKTNKGLLDVGFDHSGTPLPLYLGENTYPTYVPVVNRGLRVTIRNADLAQVTALGGATASLTIVLNDGNSDVTLPAIPGMRFTGARAAQGRANWGSVNLEFVHVSADGTTNPLGA